MENVSEWLKWGGEKFNHCKETGQRLWLQKVVVKNKEKWVPVTTSELPIKQEKGEHGGTFKRRLDELGIKPSLCADKNKLGRSADRWKRKIQRMGYSVDHKIKVSADYGDPTTRRRLYLQGVRIDSGKRIVWANPTHADPKKGLKGLSPWVPARAIIDWSLKGISIYKKPKAQNTLRRIWTGFLKELQKKGLEAFLVSKHNPEETRPATKADFKEAFSGAFLVRLNGTTIAHIDSSHLPLSEPLGALAGTKHWALIEPVLVQTTHGSCVSDTRVKTVDDTLPTLCGNRGDIAKVDAFMVPQFGEAEGQTPRTHDIELPLPTPTSHGAGAIVEYIVRQQGQSNAESLETPLSPVMTNPKHYLATAHLQEIDNASNSPEAATKSVEDPLTTIIAHDQRHALVEAMFIPQQSDGSAKPVSEPVSTIAGSGAIQLCETQMKDCAFLNEYYGTGTGEAIDAPIGTLTTKARHALIEPIMLEYEGKMYLVDFLFRMLDVHELSAGMGFPTDYQFVGTKSDKIKMIGNAVSVNTARALILGILAQTEDVGPLIDAWETKQLERIAA
jgi:DNA (cytosine-5)-methyltransferase 1